MRHLVKAKINKRVQELFNSYRNFAASRLRVNRDRAKSPSLDLSAQMPHAMIIHQRFF
jgi:hypothetical protein